MIFKKKNEFRIRRMWFLINCFDLYTRRKLYESVMLQSPETYQENEMTASFINWLFDADCKPSDLNKNDDELANEAIILNNDLQEFLSFYFLLGDDFSKEDAMAFINMLEYDARLTWIKFHHLQYPKVLNMVVHYTSGNVSYPTFKKEMHKWHTAGFPFNCNIRRMAKSLIRAEIILLEMLEKRKKRAKTDNSININNFN